MTQIHEGTVLFFDFKKGYGFLEYSVDGVKQKDMFVHYSDINMDGFKTLGKGQKVTFEIGNNKREQPKAVNVVPVK